MAEAKKRGIIRRSFRWLISPSSRWSVLVLMIIGAAVGTLISVSFQAVMTITDSDKFCGTFCHSHEKFVNPEHMTSNHYTNRTSVRARCVDCHVPHTFPAKLIFKIRAGTRNVIAEARGVISTQEKFDKERWRLANIVWDQMRANNSANCRFCHNNPMLDSTKQTELALKQHKRFTTGKSTCIECHSAMEHKQPEKPVAPAAASAETAAPK